jgi:hypothetical protein
VNRKQITRDTKARGRAIAKTNQAELLAPAAQQQYRMREAEAQLKLATMSRSPDLSGAIMLCKLMLQVAEDEGWPIARKAELLRTLTAMQKGQIAVCLMLGHLMPATGLDALAAACVECLSETVAHVGGHLDLDDLRAQFAGMLARERLAKVGGDEPVNLPATRYDVGDDRYTDVSPSVDPLAEIGLANYWIETAFKNKDFASCAILMKQLMQMAILHIQTAKQSGDLVPPAVRKTITFEIMALTNAALKNAGCNFETAIDDFRARIQSHFGPQKQIENQ